MKAKQFYCRKLLSWGTFEGHCGLGVILWALVTRINLAVTLWILSQLQLLIPSRPGDGLPRVREWSQDASVTRLWAGMETSDVQWDRDDTLGVTLQGKGISLLQSFLRGFPGFCEVNSALYCLGSAMTPISGHYEIFQISVLSKTLIYL